MTPVPSALMTCITFIMNSEHLLHLLLSVDSFANLLDLFEEIILFE